MRTALALLFVAAASAVVIDRIAVTVDNSVITESEILRQIRITALMNGAKPDFSPTNKRETAERLVEQILVRREMEVSRFDIESKEAAARLYEEFRKTFASAQAYEQRIAEYSLSDAEVRAAFEWQAMFLEFVSLRFRPGIQIPEEEIREYYDREIKPRGPEHPEARVTLEEARSQIESILTDQRVDNALDRWLGQARTQTRILYKQEAFR